MADGNSGTGMGVVVGVLIVLVVGVLVYLFAFGGRSGGVESPGTGGSAEVEINSGTGGTDGGTGQ